jgi:putative oxidoreductase
VRPALTRKQDQGMDIAVLGFRLVGGLVFAAHGAQKLFGVFGGHGIRGTAEFVEQIGLRPDERRAWYPGAAA